MNKLYLLTIFLSVILFVSCFGKNTRPSSSYIINSTANYISGNRIDNFPASELYFKLESSTRCITIDVVSEHDPIFSPNVFFIVERELDIHQFSNNVSTIFVELGRNFNSDWEHSPSVRICTISADPIQKIEPGILYRIRFTHFDNSDIAVTVAIFTNSRITFFRSRP